MSEEPKLEVYEAYGLPYNITKINDALAKGKFVCQADEPESTGIPLPSITSLGGERVPYGKTCRWGYGFSFQTDWGGFKSTYENGYFLTLEAGTRPPEVPMPKPITGTTAMIKRGWVEVDVEGETRRVDVDVFDTPANILKKLNILLATEMLPMLVTKIQWNPADLQVYMVGNEHVMTYATSVIWDTKEMQLVAAVLVGEAGGNVSGTAKKNDQGIRAILANLADNGSKHGSITIRVPGRAQIWLNPTKKGYTKVGADMRKSGARASVMVIEHPLGKDPSQHASEHFYVLAIPGEDLVEKLAQRLNKAIPWGFKIAWGKYLFEEGKKLSLVTELPMVGEDYSGALRVEKNPAAWQEIINAGLKATASGTAPGIAW